MKLHRKHLEMYEAKRRSANDNRRKVAWAVFSYIGEDDGHEYRKRFEAAPFTTECEFWKIAPEAIEQ